MERKADSTDSGIANERAGEFFGGKIGREGRGRKGNGGDSRCFHAHKIQLFGATKILNCSLHYFIRMHSIKM